MTQWRGGKILKNHKYIVDKGVFTENTDLDFSLPIPFEFILDAFNALKEQREKLQPDTAEWKEYIQEIFKNLGYGLETQSDRISLLRGEDSKASPNAIVGIVSSNESLEDLVPGLAWESYLFYAAHYYQVEWGVLTNGLQLKIFRFDSKNDLPGSIQVDIEAILNHGKLDDFFLVYKIFSFMKRSEDKSVNRVTRKRVANRAPINLEKYDLNYHIGGKPQQTVELFNALRAKIISLSSSIGEKFNKINISYVGGKNICEICIMKNSLKVYVDMDIEEIIDPLSLCRDVRQIGHHGTGNTELYVRTSDDIEAVFEIIQQAYTIIG